MRTDKNADVTKLVQASMILRCDQPRSAVRPADTPGHENQKLIGDPVRR